MLRPEPPKVAPSRLFLEIHGMLLTMLARSITCAPRGTEMRASLLLLASSLSIALLMGCGGATSSASPAKAGTDTETSAAEPPARETKDGDDAKSSDTGSEGGLGVMWGTEIAIRNPNSGDPAGPPQLKVSLGPEGVQVEGKPALAIADTTIVRSQIDDLFVPSLAALPSENELPLYALTVDDALDVASFKLATYLIARAGWPDSRFLTQDRMIEFRSVLPGVPAADASRVPEVLRWKPESLMILIYPDRTLLYGRTMVFESVDDQKTPPPKKLVELPSGSSPKKLSEAYQRACQLVSCSPSALFMAKGVQFGQVRQQLEALAQSKKKGSSFYVELRGEEPSLEALTRPSARRAGLLWVTVNGRLPPEVIQKVVRSSHDRSRKCYEEGLDRDSNLKGRLQIRFVIGRDGKVSGAADAADEMPDAQVRECVLGVFRSLEFPRPEGGIVTVVYPLAFSQEE